MISNNAAVLQTIFNGIASGALYALLAASFSFFYLIHRFFYLAFGGVVLWSAITFVLAHNLLHLSLIASGSAALAVALGSSALNEILLHATSRRIFAADDALSPFIVSSVGLLLYQNLMLLVLGPTSHSIQLPILTYGFGDIVVSVYQLVPIALIIPLLIGTTYLWSATTLGTKLRAMRDSLVLSQASGLNVASLFMIATLVAGLLGGIAAIALALNQDVRYTMGAVVVLKGITGAIIGGDRGPLGAAIGGLLVGLFEAVTGWIFPTGLSDAFVGALLISVLVALPQGLFSVPKRSQ